MQHDTTEVDQKFLTLYQDVANMVKMSKMKLLAFKAFASFSTVPGPPGLCAFRWCWCSALRGRPEDRSAHCICGVEESRKHGKGSHSCQWLETSKRSGC